MQNECQRLGRSLPHCRIPPSHVCSQQKSAPSAQSDAHIMGVKLSQRARPPRQLQHPAPSVTMLHRLPSPHTITEGSPE